MEIAYFILGVVNSLYLTVLFIRRKRADAAELRRFGIHYFWLGVPAALLLALALLQNSRMEYAIFLGIFLTYLLVAYLFDFVLHKNFRGNWKLLIPYLILYYAMNYGFFAMTWKYSIPLGAVILALLLLQFAANFWSHGRRRNGG